MAKSTLRLDTRRALNDGTYPVQIVVGYGTNIYLSTGIYVMACDWDSTTKRVIGKGVVYEAHLAIILCTAGIEGARCGGCIVVEGASANVQL